MTTCALAAHAIGASLCVAVAVLTVWVAVAALRETPHSHRIS
jgi:hypothetical protein